MQCAVTCCIVHFSYLRYLAYTTCVCARACVRVCVLVTHWLQVVRTALSIMLRLLIEIPLCYTLHDFAVNVLFLLSYVVLFLKQLGGASCSNDLSVHQYNWFNKYCQANRAVSRFVVKDTRTIRNRQEPALLLIGDMQHFCGSSVDLEVIVNSAVFGLSVFGLSVFGLSLRGSNLNGIIAGRHLYACILHPSISKCVCVRVMHAVA